LAPLNEKRLLCNSNLYDVFTRRGVPAELLCGILNSTLVAMHKHLYGRWAGTEGDLKTQVVDVKMMLIPDPRKGGPAFSDRITGALHKMAERRTLNLPDEFALPDRRELDDAVLELLGEADPQKRCDLRERLYAEMSAMYQAIREKELRMIENKKLSKNGSRLSVERAAQEVWDGLDPAFLRKFPEDFFEPGAALEEIQLDDGPLTVQSNPLYGQVGIQLGARYMELGDEERVTFVKLAFAQGRRGTLPVPRDPAACRRAVRKYREYMRVMDEEFAEHVAAKTASEKIQARIVAALKHKLAQI
jgi:hypothetical protein